MIPCLRPTGLAAVATSGVDPVAQVLSPTVVEPIRLTPGQVAAMAGWVAEGPGFVTPELYITRPRFARDWDPGDVLIVQGDAHLHLDRQGKVKEAVPDFAPRV